MATLAVPIGVELYHRRLAAGLPITDVAAKVGISASFLAVIERNGQEPPARLAAAIKQAILDLSGGYWDPFEDEYLSPTA
jgi:transcriptional regulator with XRE-family HTH domain